MTPEVQRIAIAEVCGTLRCPGCGYSVTRCDSHDHEIPYYLSDLNAMHEAEKTLTEDESDLQGKDQRCQFVTHLGRIIGCWATKNHHNSLFQQVHATAAQRAEAFLRALGKWDDSK